jgi:NAD(P)H-hydrate epimerase
VIPILSPAQASALDQAAESRGTGVRTLMERAGYQVATETARLMGGTYGRRVVVVCGKGNNGGDGLVAARVLRRWGAGVTVLLLASPNSYRDAALTKLRRLRWTEARILPAEPARLERELSRCDGAVDAIFGTGLRGPVEGAPAAAIEALFSSGRPVVSIDIPSGVDGATGAAPGPAVRATVTVTFDVLKPGLVFHPGTGLAGRVVVAGIGLPRDAVGRVANLVEASDAAELVRPRAADAHKRSAGVVLVLAGSGPMPGAAVLASRAAYRAGAGLVVLAAVDRVIDVAQRSLTEAIHLPLPAAVDGSIAESAWPLLEERLGTVHSVAAGPGLGRGEETASLVQRLVREAEVPMILDADALNAFPDPRDLRRRMAPAVLTPHAGEFGRLTGMGSDEVDRDRLGHTRSAASAFDAVVLLKGPRTVVATPDGRAFVNPTGGPNLATAGTGDVLTGTIAAWVARGLDPPDAAVFGAYVHGLAGDMAAVELGEGTTAHDVADRLPAATLAVGESG